MQTNEVPITVIYIYHIPYSGAHLGMYMIYNSWFFQLHPHYIISHHIPMSISLNQHFNGQIMSNHIFSVVKTILKCSTSPHLSRLKRMFDGWISIIVHHPRSLVDVEGLRSRCLISGPTPNIDDLLDRQRRTAAKLRGTASPRSRTWPKPLKIALLNIYICMYNCTIYTYIYIYIYIIYTNIPLSNDWYIFLNMMFNGLQRVSRAFFQAYIL